MHTLFKGGHDVDDLPRCLALTCNLDLRCPLLDLSAEQLTQCFGIFVGELFRLEGSALRLYQLFR